MNAKKPYVEGETHVVTAEDVREYCESIGRPLRDS
jgi:hypothetical protein